MNKIKTQSILLAVFVLLMVVAVTVFAVSTRTNSKPTAEKLYQQALNYKQNNDSPQKSFAIIRCCERVLKEYPDSVEATQAKQLLQDIPALHKRQYERDTRLLRPFVILRFSFFPKQADTLTL